MIPGAFDYHRAGSVEEALAVLRDRPDARPIAGGQTLLPAMKNGRAAPDAVVDVGGIDALGGVSVEDGPPGDADAGGSAGRHLSIGATTTYDDLLTADAVAEHAPGLHDAVARLGDVQVRNRGTIGGNLARAEPGTDPPAVLLATGAAIVAAGPDGERSIPAGEFVRGDGDTALGPDELLTRVEVPVVGERGTGAYAKRAAPASGYAMVGVAVRLTVADGVVDAVRVGASGVTDRPVALPGVGSSLSGAPVDDRAAVSAAAAAATDDVDPDAARSTLHASGEFRVHLLPEYVEDALRTATDRVVDERGGEPA